MNALPDPHPFGTSVINLLDPRLGAAALFASDDFFAPKERMMDPEPAVFIPGKYDDNGKWMDGWESRRKRGEGYDHCICKLGPARTDQRLRHRHQPFHRQLSAGGLDRRLQGRRGAGRRHRLDHDRAGNVAERRQPSLRAGDG